MVIKSGAKAFSKVIIITEVITEIMFRFAESSANSGNERIAVIGASEVIGAKTIATNTSRTI